MKALNRDILSLAIPNILTNLTVPLLGLVDLGLMGHLGSPVYIGAIAIGTMIFSLLYSGLMFLRMGTTGFTAQAYGGQHHRESILILGRGLSLSIIIAFLLIVLQKPIEWLIFGFVKGSSEVESIAAIYFKVRIWAAPATLGVFVFTGWFLGMQNSKIPLLVAVVINLVNIVFSVLFVKAFHMNAVGVALGTVIAQYSGLLVSVLCLYKYYRRYTKFFDFRKMINWVALKQFFAVNRDILLRSILITGTFFYFNAVSAGMGNTLLSVNSILLQFLFIFSYFIDGFAFAAESLTGKYIGARKKQNLQSLISTLLKWGLLLSFGCSLIYLAGGKLFIKALTNDTATIAAIQPYMLWVVLIPLVSFMAFIWDGIYIGATASKQMRNAMLVSVLLIFIPCKLLFTFLWGNHGLWLALCFFLLARGIALWLVHKKAVLLKV